MKLLMLSILLTAALISSAAARGAQEGRIIDRIEFEGLQQVSRDEALATSGLQTGRPFKVEEVDTAAQRLLDSGLFKQIGYRTHTSGNKITITFKLEEAVGGDSPVVFDNFIWFKDQQLTEAVRREVPSFAGRAPNAGKMPDAITHALQQFLDQQSIPGRVEYLASGDLSGRTLAHVFNVKGIKMPICTWHFPGTKNVSEKKLAGISKELSDTDYSRETVRVFADVKLFAVYRELGQLRAKFSVPVAKPDSTCRDGVDVTIPVDEGLIYSWAKVEWSGTQALLAEELNETLGVKPGEVANGLKFDKGVMAVRKAYGQNGYLEARLKATPEFDDGAQKVTYKMEVREGPQYRMGGILFKGLSERDAKAFRGAWKLKRGDVFDQTYFDEFFRNDARDVIQRLFEERRANNRPSPQLATKLSPNKESLSVDVTIELAN